MAVNLSSLKPLSSFGLPPGCLPNGLADFPMDVPDALEATPKACWPFIPITWAAF